MRVDKSDIKTLILSGEDLFKITSYLYDDPNSDLFQLLETIAMLSYGGSIRTGFVNIEAEDEAQTTYSSLIKRLDEALKARNN